MPGRSGGSTFVLYGNPRDNKRLLHTLGLSMMGTQVTWEGLPTTGSALVYPSHTSVPLTQDHARQSVVWHHGVSSPCAGVPMALLSLVSLFPLPSVIQTQVQVGITQGLYFRGTQGWGVVHRELQSQTPRDPEL